MVLSKLVMVSEFFNLVFPPVKCQGADGTFLRINPGSFKIKCWALCFGSWQALFSLPLDLKSHHRPSPVCPCVQWTENMFACPAPTPLSAGLEHLTSPGGSPPCSCSAPGLGCVGSTSGSRTGVWLWAGQLGNTVSPGHSSWLSLGPVSQPESVRPGDSFWGY